MDAPATQWRSGPSPASSRRGTSRPGTHRAAEQDGTRHAYSLLHPPPRRPSTRTCHPPPSQHTSVPAPTLPPQAPVPHPGLRSLPARTVAQPAHGSLSAREAAVHPLPAARVRGPTGAAVTALSSPSSWRLQFQTWWQERRCCREGCEGQKKREEGGGVAILVGGISSSSSVSGDVPLSFWRKVLPDSGLGVCVQECARRPRTLTLLGAAGGRRCAEGCARECVHCVCTVSRPLQRLASRGWAPVRAPMFTVVVCHRWRL